MDLDPWTWRMEVDPDGDICLWPERAPIGDVVAAVIIYALAHNQRIWLMRGNWYEIDVESIDKVAQLRGIDMAAQLSSHLSWMGGSWQP